jgi:hypothetical protein
MLSRGRREGSSKGDLRLILCQVLASRPWWIRRFLIIHPGRLYLEVRRLRRMVKERFRSEKGVWLK